MKTIEHWIDGKQTADHPTGPPVFNPAAGEQQAQVLLAGRADVEAAVQLPNRHSRAGPRSRWPSAPKVFAFRELVNPMSGNSGLITDEHGKVLSDAVGEVQRGLEVVEFACGIPHLLKGDTPTRCPPASRL